MRKYLLSIIVCTSFSHSFAQSSDSSVYFYLKGMDEKKGKLFLPAYNDLKHSFSFDSSNAETARQMGLTAVELRNYDNARLAFQKLEKLHKDDTTAISNLATLFFWTRQWDQAVIYAAKALQLHTGKNNYYILGKSYYEMEDYGHAFNYLPSAASEEPANAEIPYLIARAYVDMNNYKPAIPYFQKAIALDSTKVQWIYECALVFATIYDDQSAVKYYQIAADKGYKKDNDFYENLADSYISSGKPEKGLEILQNVLVKKPADLELLNTLGYTCYKMKKYDQAIDYWDRILGFDKQNAHALYMIGMGYQKKGDEQKGRQLCDKAIEMDPSLKSLKTEKRIEM